MLKDDFYQDPNIRTQYQSVLQELMVFFQNKQQIDQHDIDNTTDNLQDIYFAEQESELG